MQGFSKNLTISMKWKILKHVGETQCNFRASEDGLQLLVVLIELTSYELV